MEDKKLLLFGAGRSCINFIEQNPALRVVAIADNDPAKWGTQLRGISIVSPAQLHGLAFDAIVVTTVWSDSVLVQLAELGYGDRETLIPGKREMKGMRDSQPFAHAPTRELASHLIDWLYQMAEEQGVTLYLDFGTLLGALREGDFIAWDDDIDFSVNADEFATLLTALQHRMHLLPDCQSGRWKVESFTLDDQPFAIRITCEGDGAGLLSFETDIARRVRRDGQAVVIGSMPEFFCPECHFDGHDLVPFLGQVRKAPQAAEAYLDFVYGDWRTPRRDMTFADYSHATQVDFDRFVPQRSRLD